MKKYEPCVEDDLRITRWWGKLWECNDIVRLFPVETRTLSAFLAVMQPPVILITDGEPDVELAGWMTPVLGAAFFGLWVSREHRKSPRMLRRVIELYSGALTLFPALIGLTKQPHLLPEHQRLGYRVSERLPGVFDGEDAWIVTLTRENFACQVQAEIPWLGRQGTFPHEPTLPSS